MFDPSVAALFPLPLTTFEKYMLRDDQPDHPMVFAFHLTLSGEMRRADFEAAFFEALAFHPLLCAVVQDSRRCGPVWALAERLAPMIDWNELDAPIGNPNGERIDLSSEVGLRAWVRQNDDAADVTLQFHHACCDGIGALRFIGHLLANYGMRTASPDNRPTLHQCDPTELGRRGELVGVTPAGMSRIRLAWANMSDSVRFIARRTAILCPRDGESAVTAATPYLVTHRHMFDAAETAKIRKVSAHHRVTVNDLLVRDMFQTLHRWSDGQPSRSAKRWLRIMVPVNLRTIKDERMSAANKVSYLSLTRRGRQCEDGLELLHTINHETNTVSRRRRAALFLRGFRAIEQIPGARRVFLGENHCLATVVLSNLGDIRHQLAARFPISSDKLVAGNLTLEEIYTAPPVRAGTRAAFMALNYGERLCLCVHCDPRVFSQDEAKRLLAAYVARVKETMLEGR